MRVNSITKETPELVKAKKLVYKFRAYAQTEWDEITGGWDETHEKENAIQCALICIDEIIESIPMLPDIVFWKKVKKEVIKIKS